MNADTVNRITTRVMKTDNAVNRLPEFINTMNRKLRAYENLVDRGVLLKTTELDSKMKLLNSLITKAIELDTKNE